MERYCKVIPENFCISFLMKLNLILEYVDTKIIYLFFWNVIVKFFISFLMKLNLNLEYGNTLTRKNLSFFFLILPCLDVGSNKTSVKLK